jgi:enoyl-[acyl-carrier protein] reductase I
LADEFDLPKGELMKGKKGLVMGLADSHSIAYVIAAQMAAQGAEQAVTYIEGNERRAKPLIEGVGGTPVICDVTDDASMDAAFAQVVGHARLHGPRHRHGRPHPADGLVCRQHHP